MSYNANIKNANAYAFPSSNSNKNGKPTSETNLRDILTRIRVQNFVVDESTGLTLSSNTLTIPADYKVNINGTLITFNSTQTISSVPTDANVYIYLNYDNSTPPLIYGPDAPDTTVLKGVYVDYTDPSTDDEKKISLQIAKVVSGSLDTTFVANALPLTTNEIAYVDDNGDVTVQSLSDFLNTTLTDLYLSKTVDDTKEGNVVFQGTGSTKEILIDNEKIVLSDNSDPILSIEEDTISNSTGDIVFDETNNELIINGNTKVILKSGTTNIVIDNSKITIGNTTFTVSGNDIKIKPASTGKVIIESDVSVTGNLDVTGDVTGDRVFNAVYN